MMKTMENNRIIGFTVGVFDMFHVGHLNILQRAKEQCDYLIVGVNSDELVKSYKNKTPIVKQSDRMRIVESIRYVDKVILVDTLEKLPIWKTYKFDKIFIGSDHQGTSRWNEYERQLKELGDVDFVYLTHTEGVSSTLLRQKLIEQ